MCLVFSLFPLLFQPSNILITEGKHGLKKAVWTDFGVSIRTEKPKVRIDQFLGGDFAYMARKCCALISCFLLLVCQGATN